MIKVLIVDDQKLLCDLMEHMLKKSDEIEVIGTANNGCMAVEKAKELKPDVVLMDLHMPECSGLDALKLFKSEGIRSKILVLTASVEGSDISEALNNGASGYILKTVTKDELVLAIKGVFADMEIISKDIKELSNAALVKTTMANKKGIRINVNDFEIELSERDLEIIRMVVDGKSTAEMAQDLFLAEGRVRNIITELISKLMLKDKTQLAVFALKNKIIE